METERKKYLHIVFVVFVSFAVFLSASACGGGKQSGLSVDEYFVRDQGDFISISSSKDKSLNVIAEEKTEADSSHSSNVTDNQEITEKILQENQKDSYAFIFDDVPDYSENPYVTLHDNQPFFSEKENVEQAFLSFSSLDSLGRCGPAMSCLGVETMPTVPRSSIGGIRPSGWHTVKYEGIDGNYLYNRCHLIGFQLCGENANEQNLITGTRYMNVQGMEPFETKVANYISSTGKHVLFRVTPVFVGEELVARGVLMEARAVEEDDFSFCVFCYNVQPGIVINYATGGSWKERE